MQFLGKSIGVIIRQQKDLEFRENVTDGNSCLENLYREALDVFFTEAATHRCL